MTGPGRPEPAAGEAGTAAGGALGEAGTVAAGAAGETVAAAAGPTPHRFADLAARVLAAPARLGPVRLVAVDGPAGAGKTTFAARLAVALESAGASVAQLHTDDLLEGWTEPTGYWPRLEQWVLAPLRRGEPGAYNAYDWAAGRFETRSRPVPVPDVLVIEGVATGSAPIRPELTLLAWVGAPDNVRLARGIERDGEALREQWLRWMARETQHFSRDRTAEHADVRVDGMPSMRHDRDTEFLGEISGSRGDLRVDALDALRHDPGVNAPSRGKGICDDHG